MCPKKNKMDEKVRSELEVDSKKSKKHEGHNKEKWKSLDIPKFKPIQIGNLKLTSAVGMPLLNVLSTILYAGPVQQLNEEFSRSKWMREELPPCNSGKGCWEGKHRYSPELPSCNVVAWNCKNAGGCLQHHLEERGEESVVYYPFGDSSVLLMTHLEWSSY